MKSRTAIRNVLTSLALVLMLTACSSTDPLPPKKEQLIKQNESVNKQKETKEIEIREVIKTKTVYITKYDKLLIGQVEKAYLPVINSTLDARIDTGATTTSINAINIKGFERDGKKWVMFDLVDAKGNLHTKKYPVSRMVNIKRHGTKDQTRFVIKLRINISSSSQLIEVSLTNRSKFNYPILIGRNFLNGIAVVDVSKKYTKNPIKNEKK